MTVVENINSGQHDAELEQINQAIRNRMRATGQISAELQVGDQVRLKKIRPRYLIGKEVTVLKVNNKSITANIPDHAQFRTWAGRRGVRIPKQCVERV